MRALVLAFFFVSGFCGLLYEVVWIRAAGNVSAHTTHAAGPVGGVLGTVAAGFWLIPELGLRATTFVAAGVNVAIALASTAAARGRAGERLAAPPAGTPPPRLPLAVAALSGVASLLYEIAWTRSLVLALGSTVHAFTLILTAFILGLALGSALASLLLPKVKDLALALGIIQILVGVLAIALLPSLGELPLKVAPLAE